MGKKILRFFIVAVLLGGIAFGLVKLNEAYRLNRQAEEDDGRIQSYSPYDPETGEHDLTKLKEAKAVNEDVVGWIIIPGTNIDYPVLHGEDNDYYLHYTLYREWRAYGSIYLDYRCEPDFSSPNSIIYGHHMAAGNMFSQLLNFKDESFWQQHPTGWLYTLEEIYKIEFFAYYWTAPEAEPYQAAFMSPAEQERYLAGILERAIHYREIPMDLETDRMVTLSTCSYELSNTRTVVHGKLTPLD